MSAQTEITRINGAKTAIASAITAKGVTVPAETKIDDMAELIEQISGGGEECKMYAGKDEPSAAVVGDLWVDTSDEGMPSTIVAGDTPVLISTVVAETINKTSMTATGISITIPKNGTYRFKFTAGRTTTSGTWTTQLYKNGTAISGATATWSSREGTYVGDIECSQNDIIEIYARSYSTSTYNIIGPLVACIDWDIWG